MHLTEAKVNQYDYVLPNYGQVEKIKIENTFTCISVKILFILIMSLYYRRQYNF
jgi:hypothetical protein